ncbi:coagulation factor IXb isoform X1 [Gouania willdenowi]|nr:coagulation factor VII-like isoform X1 [Gouania willdenowi]XP_028323261.1 coagulation factor VII-like isoform X1 [Gouania willdenowi]XP_028323262.1 coagulation factor VII-like isoform X1 [Gouania willdenowi]XP_028323263.1 coagulation factor VII-like isoform X1 [Gouania willdenowi]XP_028323264.1 coagulation factor VII-like isoform X1 [Gouania willdenowi]
MSQQNADTVLHRQRRFNHGLEEILHKDNLERECREELCSMEEAREVFENDEKTMEFWATYIDGDQCDPDPCQNGGQCEDGISSYICWCKPNFSGKTCEIEVTKQCSVNNGGCSHFCLMQGNRAVCRCADGYRLIDRRSCEPIVQFSCGLLNSSSSSATGSFVKPRSSNSTYENFTNSTLDDYEVDLLDLDYIDLDYNDNPQKATGDINEVPLRPSESPAENDTSSSNRSRKSRSVTETQEETKKMFSWAFPTLPTITAEKKSDQRIVGGDEATPGEIPWQVTLMSHSDNLRAQPFCGGSLLSESWVITAAHCLVQAKMAQRKFFIRAGEHDIDVDEGPERDHEVAEELPHPLYDFKKSQYNHDIALLKLSKAVELSTQRRPICLGPKDFTENLLRDSSGSLVSGWGRIKFLGPEAAKLQKLQVPYVDRTTCKQSSREHITRFMFCAGYRDIQKDACQGDSGGPHATNYKGTWFLTGIVSWGEECAKDGRYGVYTRVSRYYAWITRTAGIRMST